MRESDAVGSNQTLRFHNIVAKLHGALNTCGTIGLCGKRKRVGRVKSAFAFHLNQGRRQTFQTENQPIVTLDFTVDSGINQIVWLFVDRHKVAIQFRGLITGVSEVEHIIGILRIQHQRHLATPVHSGFQRFLLARVILTVSRHVLLLLLDGLVELATKHYQSLVKIFLVQHSFRWHRQHQSAHHQ